eukprot:1866894-Pleurochrysis_carterae.AAC.4
MIAGAKSTARVDAIHVSDILFLYMHLELVFDFEHLVTSDSAPGTREYGRDSGLANGDIQAVGPRQGARHPPSQRVHKEIAPVGAHKYLGIDICVYTLRQ